MEETDLFNPEADTVGTHTIDTIKVGGKNQYLINMTTKKANEIKEAFKVSKENQVDFSDLDLLKKRVKKNLK